MTASGSESVNEATRQLLNMKTGAGEPEENPFTTAGRLGIVSEVILRPMIEPTREIPDISPPVIEEEAPKRGSVLSRAAKSLGSITGKFLFRRTERTAVPRANS